MKRFGPQKLVDVITVVTKPICEEHGFLNFKIIANWQQIVGNRIAQISYPISIKFSANQKVNGVLVVGVENPGFSLEIQANQNLILERIATYFGYKAISSIKLTVVPKKRKATPKVDHSTIKKEVSVPIKETLDSIQDLETKELLESIAKQIF
jgi:hypothetical protein